MRGSRLKLGLDAGYPDRTLLRFSSVPPDKFGGIIATRQRPLRNSRQFIICQSSRDLRWASESVANWTTDGDNIKWGPKDYLKYWHLYYIAWLTAASLWAYLFIDLLTFIYLFIYLYLTTLCKLLSLFSKIVRILWYGINITGIVVAYLTVSPLNYVWENWSLTQDMHSPTEFLTKDPRVKTWVLGSALRLQFLLRLSWKMKTQLSGLTTQYYRVQNLIFIQYIFFCRFTVHSVVYLITHTNTCIYIYIYMHVLVCVIKYVNLYILFCTIVLNYPLRSTVSEFGCATL